MEGQDSADSAVDLTTPSPVTSSFGIRGFAAATGQAGELSDRKHHLGSRGSSGEGRSAKKTAKIEAKPPVRVDHTTTPSVDSRPRRSTRNASKSKSRSKRLPNDSSPSNNEVPPDAPNIEVPPEPAKDALNCTVTLKVRLPDGECIQKCFNYKTCLLRDVVAWGHSVMVVNNADLKLKELLLCDNSVPKVVFGDLSLTLEQAGLVHNTLLHLDHGSKNT